MLDWVSGFAIVVALGLVGLVGLGFVQIVGGRSGEETHTALAGLFPAQGRRDWPMGVQEADAPRFDVAHLDALRPGARALSDLALLSIPVEIVELDDPGPMALERIDASVVQERRPSRISSMPGVPGPDLRGRPHKRS